MAQIKNWQDGSSGDSWTSAGTLNITGSLQLDNAVGTSGQVLVSSGSAATPTWGDAFVTGMIMLWSGSTGTIPSGWALCNGSSGTPDLRDRFVVGAGSTYAVDATGGSADATLPSHTHTGTTNGGGSHNHSIPHYLVQAVAGTGDIDRDNEYQQWKALSGQSTGSIGNHTHSFTTASSGTSATNANLPPYYALAYIMKL
jgi:microcystin-dependent protein